MAGISEIRIQRKLYRFEARKRYQYLRHYNVRKRERIDDIRDSVRGVLGQKKAGAKKAPGAAPAGGLSLGTLAIVAILVLVLGGAGLYLLVQGMMGGGAAELGQAPVRPEVSNRILQSDVLTVGDRNSKEHMGAVLVEYNTSGLLDYNMTLTTYPDVLPTEVFILNSERTEASSYGSFLSALRMELDKGSIILNEIDLRQLASIPQGAVVIIPSGAMPQEMYGINSTISIQELMSRGVVMVYIGQPFRSMLRGKLVANTPQDVLAELPMYSDESASLSSTSNFSLTTPLYSAHARGGMTGSLVYGSVSVIRYGDGGLVVCPQTLDGGWKSNGTLAARDISRIVFETPWADADGAAREFGFSGEGNLSGRRMFFTDPYVGTTRSLKIRAWGNSSTTGQMTGDYRIIYLEKRQKGELYVIGGYELVPKNLTGKDTTVYGDLKEASPSSPTMYVVITDSYGNEVARQPQGNINVQAGTTLRVPMYQDTGEYAMVLADDESRVYAQSYMKVTSIDVTPIYALLPNPKKPTEYNFRFSMGGNPTSVSSVTVDVDDGKLGTYTFNDVDRVAVDMSQYLGSDPLSAGMNHTFRFTIGTWQYSYVYYRYQEKIPWEVVAIVGLAGLLIGVGVVFARREAISYMLDIPDFPPISRTKVPLTPEAVLAIFAKVNSNYRWEYTPLTPPEIKNGFKLLYYQGKPILITDYNVEFLMDDLIRKHMVRENLGYYGPLAWEKEGGRPLLYLAMLRKLRDICVNNAVPFTQLGESEVCDSEVTVMGQPMFVHFCDKALGLEECMKKALASISRGITVMVFKEEAGKREFAELLHSPAAAPLLLKLEIESSSVQLQTFEEFEKMLQEFKGV